MISIVLLIFLLGLSAFLSSSETALFSLSSFTLSSYKSDENNRKRLIARLLDHPRELLVTLMMFNILCNLLVQNTVSGLFGVYSSWFLKVGIPLFLTFFFGEIIPKSMAMTNNKRISFFIAPVMTFLTILLKPLCKVVTFITNYISRFIFFFLKKDKPLSTEELYYIIDHSKKTGILNYDEIKLASGYLDLQESSIKKVMRPKDEIIFYNYHEPISCLIAFFSDLKCSRIPVCDGSLDRLLGVISIQNFFLNLEEIKNKEDLKKILDKPFYVPETIKGWELLRKLRQSQQRIAMVVDEYGSIAGLLTQEDLIETVIGEVEDLRDVKQLYIRPSDDVLIADGKMELAEIEEIFDLSLPSKNKTVTIGGWLIEQMEKIPQAGEKYINGNFLFYILEAVPSKIKRIYIRRLKK